MKKFSCFLGVFLCCAFVVTTFNPSIAQSAARSGAELYKGCSSCHTPQKRNLAGKSEEHLLKKFAFYQASDKYLAMKKLFDAMTAEEKEVLAKYIHSMK